MKKITILLIVACFLYGKSNAQEFKYGFAAGVDIADFYQVSDFEYNTSPIYSFNINGILRYRSESFWGVSAEPGFIRKGSKAEPQTQILNYIQMPLLFNMHLTDKITFSVGPDASFLVNAKCKVNSEKIDVTDIWNRFELSGVAGMCYKLTENIGVRLRYGHAVTTLFESYYFDSDGEEAFYAGCGYNQYFQLSLQLEL